VVDGGLLFILLMSAWVLTFISACAADFLGQDAIAREAKTLSFAEEFLTGGCCADPREHRREALREV